MFGYFAAVTFPHDEVQECAGEAAKWMGRANLYRVAGVIGLALAAFVTGAFVRQLREDASGRLIGGYWAATLLLIFGTWGVLTANNTELIHYPQYFIPGAVLMALTVSPFESLAWITIAAGLDECYQYWVLHGSWGIPFDFNDVFMDFLGGALGVVFMTAFLQCTPVQRKIDFLRLILARPGAAILGAIVAGGAILLASGKMLLYADGQHQSYWIAMSRSKEPAFWIFNDSWAPHKFHTLSPVEGPLMLIAALAFYGWLDWKRTFSVPDRAL